MSDKKKISMSDKKKISDALETIYQWGGNADHKTWVIDQVVRELTGDDYEGWVAVFNAETQDAGLDDFWDEGVAP